MTAARVVIVGAGIGGLAAAAALSARGCHVSVIEKEPGPGGKMRQAEVGGRPLDVGPTVLTMRDVFEDLFEQAGAKLSDHLTLTPAHVLARHAWESGGQLDLFHDASETADAIGVFAGAREARAYLNFSREAAEVYRILDRPFIRNQKPSLLDLIWRIGPHRAGDLWRINPYETMWHAVCRHFRDPRLRQLFARYSTYCGSSPFSAPATLMLIAHVEQRGVWIVDGGMHKIALAIESLARRNGAIFRYNENVDGVTKANGRANGVRLANGERIGADAVIMNGDPSAVAKAYFGRDIASSGRRLPPRSKSLSALTFAMAAKPMGFPLARHTLFFPDQPYINEFNAIFRNRALPSSPAVYVCAQDRGSDGEGLSQRQGAERLFCVVNAPPVAEDRPISHQEIEECERTVFRLMERCGLTIGATTDMTRTTPMDFAARYPGTNGSIYGRASHGWMASFQRQSTRSRIPGLYFAGGGVHPGPGAPMAALSGRLAAEAFLTDFVLAKRSRTMGMPGGMPMPSATTAALD